MLGYMFANIKHAMAQDVYIGNDKGCEVYIVTDTIQSDGGTMANVSTKYVKKWKICSDGELVFSAYEWVDISDSNNVRKRCYKYC